jgi:hypothetical protein
VSSNSHDLSKADTQVAPGVAFVDTVGDKDVLRYAATSSFSTPRYRRDKGEQTGQ